jgi:hypothetical protein
VSESFSSNQRRSSPPHSCNPVYGLRKIDSIATVSASSATTHHFHSDEVKKENERKTGERARAPREWVWRDGRRRIERREQRGRERERGNLNTERPYKSAPHR